MKKLLLITTAVAGLATVATPAMADSLDLELGGFYRGYAAFSDQDTDDLRDFDLRHDAEIHFTGETTLDNGLTVGVHAETELAQDNNAGPVAGGETDQDEIYAYFSGNWGRINVGQEDGAAYLLQVAAPSADSNIDGLRNNVNTLDISGFVDANAVSVTDGRLDYAQDFAESATKLTYLTPNVSGFQAGISYAPEVTDGVNGVGNALAGSATDNDPGEFENLIEVAARYDGTVENIGFSIGAGYSTASTESDAATGVVGSDDREAFNVAGNVTFAGVQAGIAYLEDDFGIDDGSLDQETIVYGLGWDNGPYTAGISYLDSEFGDANEADRLTVGGTYAYAPGMTFRGAVAFGSVEVGAVDNDFTQVTLGTEINF